MAKQLGHSIIPGINKGNLDSMSRMEAAVLCSHLWAGCTKPEGSTDVEAYAKSAYFLGTRVLNQKSVAVFRGEAERYL